MKFDAIVIGGGIIGCTTAYYLARKGLSVAVVEQGKLGQGTSADNFSWINGTSKVSNADYHYLNALGVTMYEELEEEYGTEALGLKPIGALGIVRKSEATDYTSMKEQAKILQGFGYTCAWLTIDDLRRTEPNINFADDTEGVSTPTDKMLDVQKFITFIAGRIRELGGAIFEDCNAQELDADDSGAVTGLQTSQGRMETSRLVLATGPTTPEALAAITGFDGFATRFPVQKVPGLLVTTPPVPEGLVRQLVYTSGKSELHFFPDFNGGLRIGSDDIDGMIIDNQSPEFLREQGIKLLNRAQAYLPDFAGATCIDECTLRVGVRAYPEDGFSLAGALPGAHGLYIVATHSGITLAPALGSLMAGVIAEGETPNALKPFALERIPGFA